MLIIYVRFENNNYIVIKYQTMNLISFILSILFALGTTTMFISSILTPSPMQEVTIILTLVMVLLSIIGIKVTYKELKEEGL